MTRQFKQWFLYGTLFSALGFIISGSDPQLEGHQQFSSYERVPNAAKNLDPAVATTAEARAKLRADAIKKNLGTPAAANPAADVDAKKDAKKPVEPAAEAAQAKKPTETDVDTEEPVAAVDGDVVVPGPTKVTAGAARSEAKRGAPAVPAAAETNTTTKPAKFEEYTVSVKDDAGDKKSFQVVLTYKDGRSKAVFYRVAEGNDCPKCRGEAHEIAFTGDADNFAAIKKKLEESLIAQKLAKAKKTKSSKGDDTDEAEDEETPGAKLLYKKVDKLCKHLDGNAELECKSKKFIEALKASKKVGKGKVKKELTITDADATAYFDANLKDYLKDMLTHKFEVPQVSTALADAYETRSVLREYQNDKAQAIKEKNLAKNLIRDLLRQIDGSYKETRKSASALYKYSLEEQEQEVVANLRDMNLARDSKDALGFKTSWASFLENFGFLKSLNTDLFTTMNDSMSFAKRTGLIENETFREIMKALNDSRAEVNKDFINNPRLLYEGSTAVLDSPGAVVTNALRGRRAGGVTSGSANSLRRGAGGL